MPPKSEPAAKKKDTPAIIASRNPKPKPLVNPDWLVSKRAPVSRPPSPPREKLHVETATFRFPVWGEASAVGHGMRPEVGTKTVKSYKYATQDPAYTGRPGKY